MIVLESEGFELIEDTEAGIGSVVKDTEEDLGEWQEQCVFEVREGGLRGLTGSEPFIVVCFFKKAKHFSVASHNQRTLGDRMVDTALALLGAGFPSLPLHVLLHMSGEWGQTSVWCQASRTHTPMPWTQYRRELCDTGRI